MSWACFLIKPEGMAHREEIYRRLEKEGLAVDWRRRVRPTERLLSVLYPDLPEPIWRATLAHLLGQPCETGIVIGEDAILRLFRIAGAEANPALCAPGTIRFDFGDRTGTEVAPGVRYFNNAIHRPKDQDENEVQMAALFS